MVDKICVQCIVSGKVQGVWYRANAKKEAEKLGITGYAKNLPDGRVEVVACGEKEKIAILCEWLRKGPERAEVTDVSINQIPLYSYTRFEVI